MFKEFYDIDKKFYNKCEELLKEYVKLDYHKHYPRHVDYHIQKIDDELFLNIIFIDHYDNYHSEFYLSEDQFLNNSIEEIVKSWIHNS